MEIRGELDSLSWQKHVKSLHIFRTSYRLEHAHELARVRYWGVILHGMQDHFAVLNADGGTQADRASILLKLSEFGK